MRQCLPAIPHTYDHQEGWRYAFYRFSFRRTQIADIGPENGGRVGPRPKRIQHCPILKVKIANRTQGQPLADFQDLRLQRQGDRVKNAKSGITVSGTSVALREILCCSTGATPVLLFTTLNRSLSQPLLPFDLRFHLHGTRSRAPFNLSFR